jgi:hypothetical protein
MTYPTASKIRELRRELAVRRQLYPKWVQQGKLQQVEADYRLDVLSDIILDYERKKDDRPKDDENS